jgi:Fe-S oxidoreductase
VVFQCPEGYLTFKKYYPEVLGQMDLELVHFYELLADKVASGAVSFAPHEGVVTYHDPCRLGRQAGIMDAPRTLIQSIPGITLKEMEHNRENGLCCGTSAWMGCSSCSKAIQKNRLSEAVARDHINPYAKSACINCALRDTKWT